jgi:hypothetical protein
MRFTLGKMFLAIAMLALAFAGMTYRTYGWMSAIVSLTWLLTFWACLQAIVQRDRKKVCWLAFFMVGSGYMLLSISESYGPTLLTNIPIALSSQRMDIASLTATDMRSRIVYAYGWGGASIVVEVQSFCLIGHCVFSWIFAVLAAWFAGRMYDRRERATKEAT